MSTVSKGPLKVCSLRMRDSFTMTDDNQAFHASNVGLILPSIVMIVINNFSFS